MKKAGIIFLAVALVLISVYSAVTLAISDKAEVDLYDGSPKPSARKAEIIYNSIAFVEGNYRYGLQVAVSPSALTSGMDDSTSSATLEELNARLAEIKSLLAASGMRVTYDAEKGFVNAIIAEYDSSDDLAIANGETGYDKTTASGTTYTGYFFSDYVIKRKTVFEPQENPTYTETIFAMLTADDFIKPDEVDFVFNYGSAYSTKLINSDADYVYIYKESETGLSSYMHEFRMSNEERSEEITIVQHTPNTISWYIIVISAVAAAAGIVFLALGVKKNKKTV